MLKYLFLLATAPLMAAVGHIDDQGVQNLMDSDATVVLLDARGGVYDDGRRIPGAGNLTYECTEQEAAAQIPTKETIVITYCASPRCPASDYLSQHLEDLGYSAVLEYKEGLEGWAAAGRNIE